MKILILYLIIVFMGGLFYQIGNEWENNRNKVDYLDDKLEETTTHYFLNYEKMFEKESKETKSDRLIFKDKLKNWSYGTTYQKKERRRRSK